MRERKISCVNEVRRLPVLTHFEGRYPGLIIT